MSENSAMITKRQLGYGCTAVGLALALGPLLLDLLRTTSYSGIGPTQWLALQVGGALILLGLTLIPLGQRPA